jgi:hypothetical protein
MTSVEFERMLSARPSINSHVGHPQDQNCIRDILLDHFTRRCWGDQEAAQSMLKEYTDNLYQKLVR